MRSVNGIKISSESNKTHISYETSRFYVSTIRCLFGMLRKKSTDLSQHDADHDLSVRENALRVMSGAPLGGTDFRLLTLRSEYVMISLILGAPVPRTAVNVRFRAPRRTLPTIAGEVPSVGGGAMHMRWPNDRAGSGDRENPERGWAKIFRDCP